MRYVSKNGLAWGLIVLLPFVGTTPCIRNMMAGPDMMEPGLGITQNPESPFNDLEAARIAKQEPK